MNINALNRLFHIIHWCLLLLEIGGTSKIACNVVTREALRCGAAEGICVFANECKCIEPSIAQGTWCTEAINLCNASRVNQCENNGICKNYAGHYHCECTQSYYYGQFCEYRIPWAAKKRRAPTGLHVHLNRHMKVSREEHILVTLYSLGNMQDRYITLTSTWMRIRRVPIDSEHFIASTNLTKIAQGLNLNMDVANLPYHIGYYYTVNTTFWQLGLQKLFVILGSELVDDYEYTIKFAVVEPWNKRWLAERPAERPGKLVGRNVKTSRCLPTVEILQCKTGFLEKYLVFDVFSAVRLEAKVIESCYDESSVFQFAWSLYEPNRIEKLREFASNSSILNIPALSISTRYTVGYVIEVEAKETKRGSVHAITKTHKFYKRRGVRINIRSHLTLENKRLTLNADRSRDYNMPKRAKQKLKYIWTCTSEHDTENEYCSGFSENGNTKYLECEELQKCNSTDITPQGLRRNALYTFRLEVVSSKNRTAKDRATRQVYVTPQADLCEINEYQENTSWGVTAIIVDYTPPEENILMLSAAWSRDYFLPANINQRLKYYWYCISDMDPKNTYCKNFKATDKIINITRTGLNIKVVYKFHLVVTSSIIPSARDNTSIEIYARDEELAEVNELTDAFCVLANIKVQRLSGPKLVLNASSSRDYKLSPNVEQKLKFSWSCSHCNSSICQNFSSQESYVHIVAKDLSCYDKFRFALKVTSSLDRSCTNTAIKWFINSDNNQLSEFEKPFNPGVKVIIQSKLSLRMDSLVINASRSRAYNFAASEDQQLNFSWTCSSFNDPQNRVCKNFHSTENYIRITTQGLEILRVYKFTIRITSATDITLTDDDSLSVLVQSKQFIVHKKKPNTLVLDLLSGPPEEDLDALDVKRVAETVEEPSNSAGIIICVIVALCAVLFVVVLVCFII